MNKLNWNQKTEYRFWSKVIIPINLKEECWIWNAYTDKDGYGTFGIDHTMKKVHRLSYEYYNGPIPKNLNVCHSCDNPSCVNPHHLWIGTQQENIDDCTNKFRNSLGSRHKDAILNENDVWTILEKINNGTYKYRHQIQKDYKIGTDTIREILQCHHWKHVTDKYPVDMKVLEAKLLHGQCGSLKKGSKLTEDDVIIIKQLIKNNISCRDIAKQFNVSNGTIHEIKSGRNWKHIL